jgi:hypothetical protein
MGVKRSAARALFVLLCSALLSHCLADDSVVLEKRAWPKARACDTCVPVQFGQLDMRLPLAEIGKILVMNSDSSALTILPPSGSAKESVLFLTVRPERLLKDFERAGLLGGLDINTNEQLFDALGKAPDNKNLAMLRKIMGIDVAVRYVKWSNDRVRVYWIQSPLPGGSQNVYFVVKGDDIVYLLAGNVTRQFLDAVLANLEISEIP